VLFMAGGASLPEGLLMSAITAALSCGVLLMQGLACSLAARTMAGALVMTFILPIVVNLGLVLFAEVFEHSYGPA
jgi:hypothetical protein